MQFSLSFDGNFLRTLKTTSIQLDGGNWVLPLMGWNLTPNANITLNAELPLFSKVKGTQLTPSYRLNAGIYFLIKGKTSTIDEFNF